VRRIGCLVQLADAYERHHITDIDALYMEYRR
jgi:hypothetical protein